MLANERVTTEQLCEDYRRVERAIQFLEHNARRQPSLEETAAHLGLSEFHFQRLFTRWVGISPKRFLQFLTKERAKSLLDRSASLLETAYATGLSGPGRLHDLFVTYEAVTPGEYKRRGLGVEIRYGVHPTPFGVALTAATERGVCGLIFLNAGDDSPQAALQDLRRRWPRADLLEDAARTAPLASQIFALEGEDEAAATPEPLHVHLSGTAFQLQVWEALLRIPSGRVVSYEDLAAHIGKPTAARAVGNAVGANPLPVLIPCHRVVRRLGELGGYHYGTTRKLALLGWEMARAGD